MANRTIVVGDIHGDIQALDALMLKLPTLSSGDTLVFLGDYVDRGPDSAGVIDAVRHRIPDSTPAQVVALRGNHEDAWLRVIDKGWPEFVLPVSNGCRECFQSFQANPDSSTEVEPLFSGGFFPADVVEWMRDLPYYYEDDHGIYVHAGLPKVDGRWLHPSKAKDPRVLLWMRSRDFFVHYSGKSVVVGHTVTRTLPAELSMYTPEDPDDMFWAGGCVYAIDTGAGKGGFLTALEFPGGTVYESRD
jgi:serine/threonine protein phosphatase 1